MSVIVSYAPTYDCPEERKDEHNEELQRVIEEIQEGNMGIVIGDLNTKVGRNNQVLEILRDEEQTINEEWCDIKKIYQSSGSEVLGHAVTRRKPWIENDTCDTVKKETKTQIDR
ncbi:uncharacterized protein [Palaemon carinicauda]|uniref:uncharacterized protein n=1 Tax=Palaemon carinicauda TaxID=392227 RepID=UPI0035B6645D